MVGKYEPISRNFVSKSRDLRPNRDGEWPKVFTVPPLPEMANCKRIYGYSNMITIRRHARNTVSDRCSSAGAAPIGGGRAAFASLIQSPDPVFLTYPRQQRYGTVGLPLSLALRITELAIAPFLWGIAAIVLVLVLYARIIAGGNNYDTRCRGGGS